MNAYVLAARFALKAGISVRTVERSLRKLGASKMQAKRAISEAKRA